MGTRSTSYRIAVIGGSIAGCGVAIAAARAGHDVVVYERSRAELAERGLGMPDEVYPAATRRACG
jgi:2-polyprenyl-6-methoxyphenol hydroxylase-like FAD-dependent oxidoreductase